MDRVVSMRVFAGAAQAGSLSAAARHLGMSPAMATRHVDALEARLGVRLFHRSTRRLTLTDAGATYLEACQRILADIDEAEAEAASQRIDASGVLRMNVPLSFGLRRIAPLLPLFSQRYPAVTVDLGLTDVRVDLLDERWDLAIRIGDLQDAPLQARRLGQVRLCLCASAAYLDQHGVPRQVADLAQHNCLRYALSVSSGSDEWRFGIGGRVRQKISGNLRCSNGDALLLAAVGGQGIIYEPDFIVLDAVQDGRLQLLELEHPAMEVGGIHAVYPPQRRPPAKVRVMIDFLAEQWAQDVAQ